MALVSVSLFLLTLTCANFYLVQANSRHAVHWNSSNIHLRREGYTVQVSVNDYLDIYCPLYNGSQQGTTTGEQYVLYMVSSHGYHTCDPKRGFKRWECNKPHAPHAPNVPIKFSEKFQRYSAFSLGYEFNVGHDYYYISKPTHHNDHSCLRLRVYVCCSTPPHRDDDSNAAMPDYTLRPNLKIHSMEFSPELPSLDKSTNGSGSSHDRLLLILATLFLSTLSVS
ncbi:ephrin-A3-like isoform X2 [Brienomyrus brachyistius]|uniref:ephrin-A3-like isoform X2 n=1 Tax=Brienomyrus brachyistius TaxID=42636 RepID=UPI0020B3A4C3|nr:ephrin-A3-like isoform X2 [Brienomyrus brachyistius]